MLTQSSKPVKKLSEEELAYEILASQGRPMYYKDLIREVLERQNRPLEPHIISAILTQINLDARFVYVSNGEWGLKVWVPNKSLRRSPKMTLLSKNSDLDFEEDLQE